MTAALRPLALAALLTLSACHESAPPTAAAPAPRPAVAPAEVPAGNELRMRIDGVDWVADHDIFGAVHPPGYDRAVLIAGSFGPKDANEQAFNMMLNGVDGPGTVHATRGDARRHVVQMANLTPQRFLAGGLLLDHDVTVELLHLQADPVRIEARFSGTLQANDETVMTIEDGRFRYSE